MEFWKVRHRTWFILPDENYFGTDEFTFTVSDGFDTSAAATVDITINPVNDPPIASAGPDQSVEADTFVTLNGSGTDVDGTIALYKWTQTSGITSTLSNESIANTIFTAPNITSTETLVYQLIVTDNEGAPSQAVSVQIVVNPLAQNIAPIAENLSVELDVSGNPTQIVLVGDDPDGSNANLIYELVSLPNTGFLNASIGVLTGNVLEYTPNSISSPDTDSFTYQVRDEQGLLSNVATVNLNAPNIAPTADAGNDRSVKASTLVTLDGGGSDIDGTIEGYSWTQSNGITTPLSDPLIANPTITSPSLTNGQPHTLTYELVVTDDDGATSVAASVTISIVECLPPVAFPGMDRSVISGVGVTLYGSGTFDGSQQCAQGENGVYTFNWTQIEFTPATEVVLIFDDPYDLSRPKFNAPIVAVATELKFQLIVEDGEPSSPPSEPAVVTMTIYPTGTVLPYIKPVADPKSYIIDATGETQYLELTGTDPDGEDVALTYEIVGQPDPTKGSVGTIYSSSDGSAGVEYFPVYPVVANSFTYIAIDQDGLQSDPVTVDITPKSSPPGNQPPIAVDINIITQSGQLNFGLNFAFISPAFALASVSDPDNDRYAIRYTTVAEDGVAVIDSSDSGFGWQMQFNKGVASTPPSTGTYTYIAIDEYGNESDVKTINITFPD